MGYGRTAVAAPARLPKEQGGQIGQPRMGHYGPGAGGDGLPQNQSLGDAPMKQPRSFVPQNHKAASNAGIGAPHALMGGGGMAVGGMRQPNGMPRDPRASRRALVAGLKG